MYIDIEVIKQRFPNYLIGEYKGYIIIAQDIIDYEAKENMINSGDVLGFYKNSPKNK